MSASLLALLTALPIHAQNRVMITPARIDKPLNNPDMGWGIWAGPHYFDGTSRTLEQNMTGFGGDAPLFHYVEVDILWSDVEPVEGKYDWSTLDKIMNYWIMRGKQVVLRLWVTDDSGWDGSPGSTVCPDWLWADGMKYHGYTGEAHSSKREPDYADPKFQTIYLPKLRQLLTAYAQRYDKSDGPVALFEIMGYGNWGEWHTMWSHYPWPNVETKRAVLKSVIDAYCDVIKHTHLLIAYVYDADQRDVKDEDDFLHRQALDVAGDRHIALSRNGFIDGLGKLDGGVMQKYWKTCPMVAEGDWSYQEMKNEKTHGTVRQNIDAMVQWHSNYGHFYVDAAAYQRLMKEDEVPFANGLRAGGIGYRLVLDSASWPKEAHGGDPFLLDQTWENLNAGRCYNPYPLRVYLVDATGKDVWAATDPTFDQTAWVAGQTYRVRSVIALPKRLRPGAYWVEIALVDDKGRPRIHLGIAGADGRLRYKLGELRIADRQLP